MKLVLTPRGQMVTVYSDQRRQALADLFELNKKPPRASHVEPGGDGYWYADLSPVHGPVLGPFVNRSEALEAEVEWLNIHLGHVANVVA